MGSVWNIIKVKAGFKTKHRRVLLLFDKSYSFLSIIHFFKNRMFFFSFIICKKYLSYDHFEFLYESYWNIFVWYWSKDMSFWIFQNILLWFFKYFKGQGWTGLTQCAPGLSCFAASAYYAQCLTTCPTGWSCTTINPSITSIGSNQLQMYSQCGGNQNIQIC